MECGLPERGMEKARCSELKSGPGGMDEEITSAQYIVSLTLYVPNFLPSLPSQGRSVFFLFMFCRQY